MAKEHLYKILKAEADKAKSDSRKRKAGDENQEPEDDGEKPEPKAKAKAKSKGKKKKAAEEEKWGAIGILDLGFLHLPALKWVGVCNVMVGHHNTLRVVLRASWVLRRLELAVPYSWAATKKNDNHKIAD